MRHPGPVIYCSYYVITVAALAARAYITVDAERNVSDHWKQAQAGVNFSNPRFSEQRINAPHKADAVPTAENDQRRQTSARAWDG